ncbi:sugar transferase [Enterococcus faecium]
MYFFLKRLGDIVFSILGLIFFSPVFVVIMLLIKVENLKGSVFFKQERVGKEGRIFHIYKFRTMVVEAEQLLDSLTTMNEMDGPIFKIKDDPRITRVGKYLRKTSLDEFPQFINVLKGEMSLIGPRPPLPREVEKYTQRDLVRLTVKPGCTGLWQVSGRNNVNFDEMINLDLQYIQNQALTQDIKIFFKTLKVIINQEGC